MTYLMTEDQIRMDQSKHHDALLALTTTYHLMTELNEKDHHIERQIMHVINLIQDKDNKIGDQND
jgi:hypothetical protein